MGAVAVEVDARATECEPSDRLVSCGSVVYSKSRGLLCMRCAHFPSCSGLQAIPKNRRLTIRLPPCQVLAFCVLMRLRGYDRLCRCLSEARKIRWLSPSGSWKGRYPVSNPTPADQASAVAV